MIECRYDLGGRCDTGDYEYVQLPAALDDTGAEAGHDDESSACLDREVDLLRPHYRPGADEEPLLVGEKPHCGCGHLGAEGDFRDRQPSLRQGLCQRSCGLEFLDDDNRNAGGAEGRSRPRSRLPAEPPPSTGSTTPCT